MSTSVDLRIKVFSVPHFEDLLKRGYVHFDLEVIAGPGKSRSKNLFVTRGLDPNFAYDMCVLVLGKPQRYQAAVYLCGDWSAHDIAEETARWNSSQ